MSSTPPGKRLLMGSAPASRPPPALSREALAAIAALDGLQLDNGESEGEQDVPVFVEPVVEPAESRAEPPPAPPIPEPPEPPSSEPIALESLAPESLVPDALEPDPDDLVLRWDETLDVVDYFTLLRLTPPAAERTVGEADVRAAFHAFALAFHPDRYRGSEDGVREAANRVYCRGAEAYRVLLDPLLRRRYVRLVAEGTLRMSPEEVADATKGRGSDALADLVKSAAARPFAKRADELIALGDLKQARLQLRLALTKETKNVRLEERMRELEQRISGKSA